MQLSIAGALIVFAVVACAGLGIAWQIGKSDRAQFDASPSTEVHAPKAKFADRGPTAGNHNLRRIATTAASGPMTR